MTVTSSSRVQPGIGTSSKRSGQRVHWSRFRLGGETFFSEALEVGTWRPFLDSLKWRWFCEVRLWGPSHHSYAMHELVMHILSIQNIEKLELSVSSWSSRILQRRMSYVHWHWQVQVASRFCEINRWVSVLPVISFQAWASWWLLRFHAQCPSDIVDTKTTII